MKPIRLTWQCAVLVVILFLAWSFTLGMLVGYHSTVMIMRQQIAHEQRRAALYERETKEMRIEWMRSGK